MDMAIVCSIENGEEDKVRGSGENVRAPNVKDQLTAPAEEAPGRTMMWGSRRSEIVCVTVRIQGQRCV